MAGINECGESNCEQVCINTLGPVCYACACRSGYRLDDDGHSCNGSVVLLVSGGSLIA